MKTIEGWLRQCLRKKRYSSYGFANQVAAKIKTQRFMDLRIYNCPCCQGYHLTKKELENGREFQGSSN